MSTIGSHSRPLEGIENVERKPGSGARIVATPGTVDFVRVMSEAIVTCSSYTPGSTRTVSPLCAAVTAGWIIPKFVSTTPLLPMSRWTGPLHGLGVAELSHGTKETVPLRATSSSPVPAGFVAVVGPDVDPHQLNVETWVPEYDAYYTCTPSRL